MVPKGGGKRRFLHTKQGEEQHTVSNLMPQVLYGLKCVFPEVYSAELDAICCFIYAVGSRKGPTYQLNVIFHIDGHSF